MSGLITYTIYTDYLNCPHKAYQKIIKKTGKKTDFKIMQDDLLREYKISTNNYLQEKWKKEKIISNSSLKQFKKNPYTRGINIRMTSDRFDVLLDGIIKERKYSTQLVPLIIINKENLAIIDRLKLAFCGFVLGTETGTMPQFGRMIYGSDRSNVKVKIDKLIPRVRPIVEKIESFLKDKSSSQVNVNKHCQVCEFGNECMKTAREMDDLSLLSGLNATKIKKLNNKGIFTVNQLSYTFKPRRKRKNSPHRQTHHRPELKALALRENKIHVYVTPKIQESNTEIYLDIENLPYRNFYYLVGMLINDKGTDYMYSFWADNKNQEYEIFVNFLDIINGYKDYIIYHYGQFERIYLKRMIKKLNETERKKAEKLLDRCCNVLSFFYSNTYIPTYTNSLKDIAKYLGFKWDNESSSGIQSIIWRTEWEKKKNKKVKNMLLQYNMDDCYALKVVKSFLSSLNASEESRKYQNIDMVYHRNLKIELPFKFLNKEFADSAIENIHKYSLFDYQRQRVFFRTDDFIRKSELNRRKKRKSVLRPNKTINISARVCVRCKSRNIHIRRPISKRIIDLKFTSSGVKRWITKLSSSEYYCTDCSKSFQPARYLKNRVNYVPKGYRKGRTKYGHVLKSWVIFQHIVNHQSFRQIGSNLYEYFKLRIDKSTLHEFKNYIVKYYEPTYELLKKKILNSDILYVDETPLKMKSAKGYAWVFTNNREIVSIYQSTRKGNFLKEMLIDYRGVLVSDFYTAYDSIKCIHQKCLIHLIRDMNDDLLKNPFNEELKFITQEFTGLMQRIVKTIDRFGLKKKWLYKYCNDADKIFDLIAKYRFKTDIGLYYQERFSRNRDRIFEFLQHENVSWNNNNAEKAIKLLATHTNRKIVLFSEDRMREYLKIMSIYQTCVYNNISFLKFLRSKVRDIDRYIEDYL